MRALCSDRPNCSRNVSQRTQTTNAYLAQASKSEAVASIERLIGWHASPLAHSGRLTLDARSLVKLHNENCQLSCRLKWSTNLCPSFLCFFGKREDTPPPPNKKTRIFLYTSSEAPPKNKEKQERERGGRRDSCVILCKNSGWHKIRTGTGNWNRRNRYRSRTRNRLEPFFPGTETRTVPFP